mmetsp:Transcript_55140/g.142034  ORF Transcript_55140/g.142034 Transcript_55140/m.142034 type:complete len:234 (+) Transcript_55140:492-1193(+)
MDLRSLLASCETARLSFSAWEARRASMSAVSCLSKASAASSSCACCSLVNSSWPSRISFSAPGHSPFSRTSSMRSEYSSTECFCLRSGSTARFFTSSFSRLTRRSDVRMIFILSLPGGAAQPSFMRAFSWRITSAADSSSCVCSCPWRRSASSSWQALLHFWRHSSSAAAMAFLACATACARPVSACMDCGLWTWRCRRQRRFSVRLVRSRASPQNFFRLLAIFSTALVMVCS